ncbi:MAG: amino acid ABC transporter substrate-binding protein [Rhodobacteraceae bacterium]|nr:amino acid ABC transporter substrate-binding protein [Paracoccaceae bacterium]MAY44602.1 amino acid ABC transporter substrate-binding protein [Paracoccaceae bacterium]QEW19711.1 putative periplasmatic binding protein [Marinibacterium anthonyi]
MHGLRHILFTATLAAGVTLAALASAQGDTSDLVSKDYFRVCADPANMPFSNDKEEGFENRIASLFAEKLERPVQYTWFPQATGFVRRTLAIGKCDVVIGFAQGHELVLNTNHYYTSAYAIVVPKGSDYADVDHLGDARLADKVIGVTAGSPPATHMARLGLIGKAEGYKLMVDRRAESPAELMLSDLEAGKIDAAILWGPLAGYYARDMDVVVTPLLKEEGSPKLFYRITMGVRQGELSWKRELNSLIRRNQDEIDAILTEYGVPLVDEYGRAD